MDIIHIDGRIYQIIISNLQYTIDCNNKMECKQQFLDMISNEFDNSNYCEYTIISTPKIQLSKDVIPFASEANKMTNCVIDNCAEQQLVEISKLIKTAITDGKFSISEERYLKPETQKKLEELGYKIETGNQYNESYYSISWR